MENLDGDVRRDKLSELATMIKNKREEKEMSQEDLAREVEVSAGSADGVRLVKTLHLFAGAGGGLCLIF